MGVCDCTKKCLEENPPDSATTNHVTSNVVKVTIKDQQDDPQQQESFIVEGHPAYEGQNRIQWSSPVEFLLTCIGYSVGLGNVWRFPYLCYKNGGGAFLIPYSLMMLFIGMPLLFMEYSFGQYFGIGSLSIFKQVCPLFQGVGIGYSILNGLVGIYYNVIIAISIYFLFGSFSTVLPWSHCNNTWNTENCEATPSYDGGGDDLNSTFFTYNSTASVTTLLLPPMTTPSSSSSSSSSSPFSVTSDLLQATLLLANRSKHLNSSHPKSSPSDEFFRLSLMGETDENSIANLGHVQWPLCLCLLLSWILVAMFVSQGIKSSGKVAYFTATFPYVMLTILVVRGVTLNGATDGLLYFIDPVWDKLMSPDVWFQAATQLFYSLNLAWGGMITMSSYNLHNHNCFRDAIVINCVSFGTSLYAGVAVFSIIGYMAKESGIPIPQVIKSGPGLAFIAYPRALSLMPFPQLWSVLFFVMLFLLGIGSQMVCVETIMTGIMDTWRFLVVKWQYRVTAIAIVCSLGFFLGIPCTTQGGMYVLQLMDHYSAGFCVLIIAIVECVVINWIYGDAKMAGHVKYMLGKDMNPVFRICWKYISPSLILVILLFSFVRYTPVVYAGKTYPIWADVIGWMMTLASNIPIVVVAVYMLCTVKGTTLKQRFQAAIQPQVDEESSERRHRESVYLNSKRDDVTLGCDANSDVMIGCDVNNDVRLHQCEMKLQSSDDVAINGEPL